VNVTANRSARSRGKVSIVTSFLHWGRRLFSCLR
jgi:hypothetical protein